MADRAKYRKPLPKRFNAAMSEEAYAGLRRLAEHSELSNNYVLTVIFEYADDLIDPDAFDRSVRDMLDKARVT